MAVLFIKIDQTIGLEPKIAQKELDGLSSPNFSVQFNFAVKSGSIGFEVASSAFVEGGVTTSSEGGSFLANISGLAKVKIFEMQETQFAERCALYIRGISVEGTYTLIDAKPLSSAPSVKHDGGTFPLAVLAIGQKKSALSSYP